MAFRIAANIDANHHKGLVVLNSINAAPLVLTGSSLTNSQPLHVAIVDGSGSQISSFGGGTQYAELVTTAPGTGTLSLGRYKATPPTLTDGQLYGLQLDSSGSLKVTGAGGGTQYTSGGTPPANPIGPTLEFNNAGTWATVGSANPLPVTGSLTVGGTTDNSAFTAGTSTGTPTMGFYHSVIDTVTDGRAAAVGITPKRGLLVNLNTAAGVEIGTSGSPLRTDPTGTTAQPVTNTGTFAVQAAQSGTWNITNISGTVSLPTGASTEASLAKLTLAQGSTTSGQSGTLVQGAVTTAAPSYTTAQTSPLSLDTAGNLRTSTTLGAGSAVIGHVITDATSVTAATLSAETTKVIGVVRNADGAGNLLTSTANALDINIKSGSIANTSFAATQATASSLNATVVGTGTFAVQATLAAETTKIIGTVNQGTSPWVTSNATTSVVGNGAAATAQRVTLANDSTGIIATVGAVTAITNALPAGTNLLGKVGIDQTTPGTTNAVSANQGTAAALASGWVVINGEQADTTGTFTNATQTTSVTATNLAGYGNVLISINGTFGTASAIFEGSDDGGANWYTINEASRTDSSTIENGYTSLTNTTRAWQTNNPGWDSLRVRSTAVASGTVNVRISPSAAPSAAGATVSISGTVVVDDLAAAPTGSAVPANAQYDGLLAQNALPTAATPGNLTGMLGDKFGRPIVLNNAPRDIMGSQTTTITSSTAETTIITQAASIFNDLVSVFISNTSATAARVDIRDTTGGSIIFQLFIPAGDMRGLSLTTPWPQTTVNNNWTAQSSASVADLRVSALFVKNK